MLKALRHNEVSESCNKASDLINLLCEIGNLSSKGRSLLSMIKIERIYNNPKGNNSSFRILVDRLWPRGLSKDTVKLDLWLKDISPSNSLRKWFSHDQTKWNEFKVRYFKELDKNNELVDTILDKLKRRYK